MLAAPASSATYASHPQDSAIDTPAADQSENRPPTHSHIGSTSELATPNARAASGFAVTATKCRASAPPPPRLAASHSRADCAFLKVSVVVKVFEVTTNSVVAGSSP